MNLFQKWLADNRVTSGNADEMMDEMQLLGIISDNAINPENVADADFPAVRTYLERDRRCKICKALVADCNC